MPLVFQYGSNCSRLRLESRLKERVEDLGRALTVEEFEIAFNKRRQESGSAAADLVKPRKGKRIWGVLYEVSKAGFKRLKVIEGPSYRPKNIVVEDSTGVVRTAKTFRVKRDARRRSLWTTAEYVSYIVNGLRAHEVPEEYVQHVLKNAIETNARAFDTARGAAETRLIRTL